MKSSALHNLGSLIFGTIAFTLVAYILISNFAPFGITKAYSSGVNKEISDLGPKDRVSGGVQTSDLIYFTTQMPFHFDSAKVKITYQNQSPDQELYLGFQDQDIWHYDSKLIDTPILDGLTWQAVGDDPVLFQKTSQYKSVNDFLSNPPTDQIVGTYDFDKNSLSKYDDPSYTPSQNQTVIDTPLRGKHTLYVYLKNEPFKMIIDKQDLNWYEDPDTLSVKIYKDQDIVYQATIDDDGVTDASQQVLPPQEVSIENPGPGLPENGVYKVILDGSGDTVIRKISTNLQKIVLEGPIFTVGNHEVYPKLIEQTTPANFFTDALVVTAKTVHGPSLQDIRVGDQTIKLTQLNTDAVASASGQLTQVQLPKSDAVINGILGYFALSKDQFFRPSPYKLLSLTKKSDLDVVDYVLTSFKPPRRVGDDEISEQTFDLSSAFVKNGKLSWLLRAPGLKENGRQVIIKKIEVEFVKKPWKF